MRQFRATVLVVFALTLSVFGQDDVPTFKSGVRSAFVWGEDFDGGATSSSIRDPLTGRVIRKLAFEGIEVSSRVGFERIGHGRTGAFLSFITTVVNATESKQSLHYGGISIDGRSVSPLRVLPTLAATKKRDSRSGSEDRVELGSMYCFTGGFLPSENFFPTSTSPQSFDVSPGAALTVSSVVVDPNSYALRCDIEGCFPRSTMRYYLNINRHDYVFVWPGRSAVFCGK